MADGHEPAAASYIVSPTITLLRPGVAEPARQATARQATARQATARQTVLTPGTRPTISTSTSARGPRVQPTLPPGAKIRRTVSTASSAPSPASSGVAAAAASATPVRRALTPAAAASTAASPAAAPVAGGQRPTVRRPVATSHSTAAGAIPSVAAPVSLQPKATLLDRPPIATDVTTAVFQDAPLIVPDGGLTTSSWPLADVTTAILQDAPLIVPHLESAPASSRIVAKQISDSSADTFEHLSFTVTKGFDGLGFNFSDNVPNIPGFIVKKVKMGGAAAAAGLLPDDILLAVDGLQLGPLQKADAVAMLKNVGVEVRLDVARRYGHHATTAAATAAALLLSSPAAIATDVLGVTRDANPSNVVAHPPSLPSPLPSSFATVHAAAAVCSTPAALIDIYRHSGAGAGLPSPPSPGASHAVLLTESEQLHATIAVIEYAGSSHTGQICGAAAEASADAAGLPVVAPATAVLSAPLLPAEALSSTALSTAPLDTDSEARADISAEGEEARDEAADLMAVSAIKVKRPLGRVPSVLENRDDTLELDASYGDEGNVAVDENLVAKATAVVFDKIVDAAPPSGSTVTLQELQTVFLARIAQLAAHHDSGYKQEFFALQYVGLQHTAVASTRPENMSKNRYTNILAYDHSRVKLAIVGADPFSDYVNANRLLDGAYIACQGPLPATVDAFWRMVWEQRAGVVVMLTQEVEGGKRKCHRYWPDPSSHPPVPAFVFDDLHVAHVETAHLGPDFTRRSFSVRNGATVARTVVQWCYNSWPDHGAPATTAAMLQFRKWVGASADVAPGPVVVHCSAGVGRSGSFVTLDYLLQQASSGGVLCIDVPAVVTQLRNARPLMVQTFEQYTFVHRALVDGLSALVMDRRVPPLGDPSSIAVPATDPAASSAPLTMPPQQEVRLLPRQTSTSTSTPTPTVPVSPRSRTLLANTTLTARAHSAGTFGLSASRLLTVRTAALSPVPVVVVFGKRVNASIHYKTLLAPAGTVAGDIVRAFVDRALLPPANYFAFQLVKVLPKGGVHRLRETDAVVGTMDPHGMDGHYELHLRKATGAAGMLLVDATAVLGSDRVQLPLRTTTTADEIVAVLLHMHHATGPAALQEHGQHTFIACDAAPLAAQTWQPSKRFRLVLRGTDPQLLAAGAAIVAEGARSPPFMLAGVLGSQSMPQLVHKIAVAPAPVLAMSPLPSPLHPPDKPMLPPAPLLLPLDPPSSAVAQALPALDGRLSPDVPSGRDRRPSFTVPPPPKTPPPPLTPDNCPPGPGVPDLGAKVIAPHTIASDLPSQPQTSLLESRLAAVEHALEAARTQAARREQMAVKSRRQHEKLHQGRVTAGDAGALAALAALQAALTDKEELVVQLEHDGAVQADVVYALSLRNAELMVYAAACRASAKDSAAGNADVAGNADATLASLDADAVRALLADMSNACDALQVAKATVEVHARCLALRVEELETAQLTGVGNGNGVADGSNGGGGGRVLPVVGTEGSTALPATTLASVLGSRVARAVEVTRGPGRLVGVTLAVAPTGELMIKSIAAESAASQLGLQPGDILLEVDGQSCLSCLKADGVALLKAAGDIFTMVVLSTVDSNRA